MRQKLILAALLAIYLPQSHGLMINPNSLPPTIPPARIVLSDITAQAIVLDSVKIDTQVFGNQARSVMTVVLSNPNNRPLEGNFEFPLLSEQRVSGFALDINGKLRDASSVPKARAQEIFEDIRRVHTDPGLLGRVEGNVYRLRVYPIPANGTRTVQITIDQSLIASTNGTQTSSLRFPLAFSSPIKRFEMSVSSANDAPLSLVRNMPQFNLSDSKGFKASADNFTSTHWLELNIPQNRAEQWQTQTKQSQYYTLAQLPIDTATLGALTAPRARPQHLAIFWDASTSTHDGQTTRAIAVLEAYLSQLSLLNAAAQTQTDVTLHIVRNTVQTQKTVPLDHANKVKQIIDTLRNTVPDGATRLDNLAPAPNTDLVLLFSDGLATFGQPHITVTGNAPVIALNPGVTGNANALTRLVDARRGTLIDLAQGSTDDIVKTALQELTQQRASIKRMSSTTLSDLIAPKFSLTDNTIQIAGRSTELGGQLTVDIEDATGTAHTLNYAIPKNPSTNTLPAQQWAQWQIDAKSADLGTHRKAIERLSSEHGLISDASSLLVLETAQQYAQYNITPPEELRESVEKLKSNQRTAEQNDRQSHMNQVIANFKAKTEWWNKDFPRDKAPPPEYKKEERYGIRNAELTQSRTIAPAAMATAAPAPIAASADASNNVRFARSSSKLSFGAVGAERATTHSTQPTNATISLKKWESNAPYIARFKTANDANLYAVYLDERVNYRNSTAFYLDAADVFFARKQPELALRILSNLAEMNLDNRQVLRILSYRLMQAHQTADAIPFLQRVTELAPNEPQSWRDLGLAHAAIGANSEAIKNLWTVVSKPWHGRFPGIEQIALNELNAIAATAKTAVDMSEVDERLRQNQPVDLRAVLAWDADDTDIDLWVTDPNGEKVYYAHRLSRQGGRISNDFTGGYGPEEFLLKKAIPGKYKVEAQFYGHRQQVVAGATSLMLKLTTHFGQKNQSNQDVILRLSGQKESVLVGEFTVK